MIPFFIIAWALFAPLTVAAQETAQAPAMDQQTIDQLNSVIVQLFDEAMAAKEKYEELAQLDKNALTQDENGFYALDYRIEMPAARGKTSLYALGLTVSASDDKIYADQQGYFTYPLPLLGLQFSGYMVKHPLRRQFDIKKSFERFNDQLVDYQQPFMPLRMTIAVEKETFEVGEPIRFKVVLANVTNGNLLVKRLGQDTLFFTLNDQYWGTSSDTPKAQNLDPRAQRRQEMYDRIAQARAQRDAQRRGNTGAVTRREKKTTVGDRLILGKGEALTLSFIGEPYKRAQDVQIRGIYQMNIKGLKPTATRTLKIVPRLESLPTPAAQ